MKTISSLCSTTVSKYPRWLYRVHDTQDIHAFLTEPYFKNGKLITSSRTIPLPPHTWKVGEWRQDRVVGPYGQMTEVLLEIPIKQIILSEADYTKSNQEGRGNDADRYAQWLAQGRIPPPVTLLETDQFQLKLIDGHRRVAAAKIAGRKTIQAWVSFAIPTGKTDIDGKAIFAAATTENLANLSQLAERVSR